MEVCTPQQPCFDKENNICTAQGNPPRVREDHSCNTCTKKTLYSLTQSQRKVYLFFASLSLRATYFDFNRNKHPKTRKLLRFGEKTSLFLLPHVFFKSVSGLILAKTTRDFDHHFLSFRRFDHHTVVGIQLPLRVRREENLKSTTWLGAVQDELS